MVKYLVRIILVGLSFSSCAAMGTKTLYKSDLNGNVKRIGFTRLDGNRIVSIIFPRTNEIFQETFTETFKKFNLKDITSLDTELSVNKPDTSTIVRLCNEDNLDVLIVSRLKFIHTSYSAYFIPLGQSYDTEVVMKVFDRKGKLLLSVLHNTVKGNSYFKAPTADRTVKDGTEGSIRRIARDFGLEEQKRR